MIHHVDAQHLETLIATQEIIFVDFWAEWCAPCKLFTKVYEKIATQYPAIHFAQINIEQQASLAETFQIRSIPHLIVFKQETIIYSESGSLPESALRELVEQALQVDMKEIQATLIGEE